MSQRKKIGFLDSYIANNVNLADPVAGTKWKSLVNHVNKYKSEASSKYKKNSFLNELFRICQSDDVPDKLMTLGRNLEEFINTEDELKLKKDNQLLKIIELYSETTIASNDKRAIDLATEIMTKIIKIREM